MKHHNVSDLSKHSPLPEQRGDGTAKLVELERVRRENERQQRLKFGGEMSTRTIGVDALIKSWPLPDGQEVEVKSSPKLWDFISAKRHPQQRPLQAKLLTELEDCFAKYGYINGLCEPIQVHGEHTINWQHRTEVFKKNDPEVPVRIVFGVPLAAMSIASRPWSKDQIATLALSSALKPGEIISKNDKTVVTACETIVYLPHPCTAQASNDASLKWLNEARIARDLKTASVRHPGALAVGSVRACLALAIARFGEKGLRIYDAILSEESGNGVTGFFLLLDKWSKRGASEHRRYGAACLRGLESWAGGHPHKSWRVSAPQERSGTGSIEIDEETRKKWRQWKKTQKTVVLPK